MQGRSDRLITHDDTRFEELDHQVIDSGIGFDESSLSHLFKPFTKNDTPSPGAGLGLHITKTLVTSMGGRLELRSEAGVGTTFMVTIPVKLEEPGPRVDRVRSDSY